MPDPVHKERDWIDLGLKASTPLIVGLVVAWIGIYGDEALNTISHRQQSARLITELQIRREQDESALRKDIFTRALDAFLVEGKPAGGNAKKTHGEMSKQLLRLELLALNFGDSLSLTPLFVEMHKDLRVLRDRAILDRDKALGSLHEKALLNREKAPVLAEKEMYEKHEDERRQWELMIKRLTSLAKRVASSQASALALHGQEKTVIVPLDARLPRDTYDTYIDKMEKYCDKRSSQGSDRLPSDLDNLDLFFTWPQDEAWLMGKQVIVDQLKNPIRSIRELVGQYLAELEKKVTNSKHTYRTWSQRGRRGLSNVYKYQFYKKRFEVARDRYERLSKFDEDLGSLEADIETYMDDGLKTAADLDEVYSKVKGIYKEVKQVVDLGSKDPDLTYENGLFHKQEFIEKWNSLIAPFEEEADEDGVFHFLGNSLSPSEIVDTSPVALGDKAYINKENEFRRLEFQGVRRDVELVVSEVDYCLQSLRVELKLVEKKYMRGEVIDGDDKVTSSFDLDYFNFPTVDNTRLAHNHRFAVVIEEFDVTGTSVHGPHIRLALLVFPSEYASLRDRPGMEEVRGLLEEAMAEPGGN